MKALHIARYGRFPNVIERDIPIISSGQYLIRMIAAPINPSDINHFQGFYGFKKQGFAICGFEGVGEVIKTSGHDDQKMLGSIVSVLANMSNGTFSTHIALPEENLIKWPKKYTLLDQEIHKLSTQWVNPVSCIGLAEITKRENAATVIISAATSQVARMLAKYLKKTSPTAKIIGFSRNQALDSEMKRIGFSQIYRFEDLDVIKNLKNQHKTVFLDCVGGPFASRVFKSMPKHSTLVSYGRLSKEAMEQINPGELYFNDKRIEGFWMSTYLEQITKGRLQEVKEEIIDYYEEIFQAPIRAIYSMENFQEAVRDSVKSSSGKVILDLCK